MPPNDPPIAAGPGTIERRLASGGQRPRRRGKRPARVLGLLRIECDDASVEALPRSKQRMHRPS